MKKTSQTNNPLLINNYQAQNNEIKEIECLYVYNQKDLLKPIEYKNYSDDYYVKILK